MKSILYILILTLTLAFAVTENSGTVVMPAFFSMPETGFGAGAFLMQHTEITPNPTSILPDTFVIGGIYTEKAQLSLGASKTDYSEDGLIKLVWSLNYSKFPMYYYGIGPNTQASNKESYTPVQIMADVAYLYEIKDKTYFGPLFSYAKYSIDQVSPTGSLAPKTTYGSDGAYVSALGFQFSHDSRDNVFFTSAGKYLDVKAKFYRQFFGSQENFNIYNLDARIYHTVISDNIIAQQLLITLSNDKVPFQLMPQLGGSMIMRGFYHGRYIDYNYVSYQLEYRFPIWGIIGGSIYTAVGQVFPTLDSFNWNNFKSASGMGLRFNVAQEQHINVRMDIAMAEGDGAMYISIMEAF